MHNFGERLKQARAAAGLSQRALAECVDLSAMAISKYETSQIAPSSDVLLRLAKAMGVKFEYFFRPITVDLADVEYRKRSRFPERKRVAIEHQAAEQVERYLAAESVFGPDAFPPFRCPRISESAIADMADAERAARLLRQEWELGDDSIDSLCEVLEDRGVKVVVVDADAGFDGFKGWVEGQDERVPVIGVRREPEFGDRQRLSMAHELGHLLLCFAESAPQKLREAAAYRFAAAFLAPESAVRLQFPGPVAHLSLQVLYSLKHKWGLSMSAWARRLRDLEIITESTHRRFCVTFKQNRGDDGETWWSREPGKQVVPEIPRRFQRLVEQAVAQDIISTSRAADLLGKPLIEVRREMRWPQEAEPV